MKHQNRPKNEQRFEWNSHHTQKKSWRSFGHCDSLFSLLPFKNGLQKIPFYKTRTLPFPAESPEVQRDQVQRNGKFSALPYIVAYCRVYHITKKKVSGIRQFIRSFHLHLIIGTQSRMSQCYSIHIIHKLKKKKLAERERESRSGGMENSMNDENDI